jgi:hypothetical protein
LLGDIKVSATADPIPVKRRIAGRNAARGIPCEPAASPHPGATRILVRPARNDPPQVADETLEAILDAEG